MDMKLIFIGPPGAGKSTAIKSLSDTPPVSTEVPASDEQRMTTVAMDFGEMTLEGGDVVRLFGIPGQGRFEFIWPLIAEGAFGAFFFLDARHPTPLKELEGYLDSFGELVRAVPSILAVTHGDETTHRNLKQYARFLAERGLTLPVVEIDPRQRKDVGYLLDMLLAIQPGQDTTHA